MDLEASTTIRGALLDMGGGGVEVFIKKKETKRLHPLLRLEKKNLLDHEIRRGKKKKKKKLYPSEEKKTKQNKTTNKTKQKQKQKQNKTNKTKKKKRGFFFTRPQLPRLH